MAGMPSDRANAGRNQLVAMERLAQILFVLSRSTDTTSSVESLLNVVHYGSEEIDNRRRQLVRDIDQLRAAGWDIRNTGAPGEEARYRLVAGDLRLRVAFAADEQAELQRVARLISLSDGDSDEAGMVQVVAAPPALDLVLHAVQRRCLLRFEYRGSRRVVHPQHVHSRSAGWYLSAREVGGDTAKAFRIDRMIDAQAQDPGTADPISEVVRLSLDPMAWQVDPPLDALVQTTAEHLDHVTDLLDTAERVPSTGDEIQLRVPVTNRAAFRARLYELGERVRLLGPAELRHELRAELLAVAGAGRP